MKLKFWKDMIKGENGLGFVVLVYATLFPLAIAGKILGWW